MGVHIIYLQHFSVYPQELIYRTFYFHRYSSLFRNKTLFIFLNAILFSLAHLFFRNALVLILTFSDLKYLESIDMDSFFQKLTEENYIVDKELNALISYYQLKNIDNKVMGHFLMFHIYG